MNDGSRRSARRTFLRAAGGLAGTAALATSPVGRLLAAAGSPGARVHGYGPLRPVLDRTTGLPLLELPSGFEYLSFGWTGDALDDGTPTPRAHDGMGVVAADGDMLTLVRNHEVVRNDGAFGPAASHYDPVCSGGTVTLRFDGDAGRLVRGWPSLSGTLQNCSGGVTPWGSWLSCEELVSGADHPRARQAGMRRSHGFVFEVPADGVSDGVPLVGLGQFRHEAAAVHAHSGAVYLTEDMEPYAGFYRFLPVTPGRLAEGGRLQMLRVPGRDDLRTGVAPASAMPVEWIDIERPDRGLGANGDGRGVQRQGFRRGASRFIRLEGCFAGADDIHFVSTSGGDARCGQVFVYNHARNELVLLFESRSPAVLDYPDNLCLGPRGGLVLCEDSSQPVQQLHGLTGDGGLFALMRSNVVLAGSGVGAARRFRGDFRGAEWAGACFSPDGRWLFVNNYSPGFSLAITGPWESGPL